MNPLIHIIYCSAASPDFKDGDIPALLEQSRTDNAKCDVTGMLLYVQGCFFQVLEGVATIVTPLYQKIGLDPRHARVTTIISEPIETRNFGGWTMGYSAVSPSTADDLLGENDFFSSASCLANMTPGRAKKLLSAFQGGRWHSDTTGMGRAATGPV